MKTVGQILVAGAIGAAAGAILGVLLAPEKGSDLRKKIRSTANDVLDEAKDKLASLKEALAKEAEGQSINPLL